MEEQQRREPEHRRVPRPAARQAEHRPDRQQREQRQEQAGDDGVALHRADRRAAGRRPRRRRRRPRRERPPPRHEAAGEHRVLDAGSPGRAWRRGRARSCRTAGRRRSSRSACTAGSRSSRRTSRAACLIQASASTSVVNSRQTRSGVQNSARPITACRPHGPPTASLAWATTGSDPGGDHPVRRRRAGRGRPGRARRRHLGPVRGADGPGDGLLTCSVCRCAISRRPRRATGVAGGPARPGDGSDGGSRESGVVVTGRGRGRSARHRSARRCPWGSTGASDVGGAEDVARGASRGRLRHALAGVALDERLVGQLLLRRPLEDGVHELLPDRARQARPVDDLAAGRSRWGRVSDPIQTAVEMDGV